MKTIDQPSGRDRETAAVRAWREEQLLASGFDHPLANELAAESDIDLHAVIELVERGCPPELAARIVAPL
jgi:hypothetical protein